MNTRSHLLPQHTRILPTELCERIINFVAAMEDRARVQTLCSCALTCRSWLPRSRFHLFRTVVLRSNSQLASLARTLKDSPLICKSVRNLTVVGAADSDRSESWITLVPMSLSPAFRSTLRRSTLPVYPTYRSHRLGRFTLCDIDLTKRHPRFHQAYSLLGPVANPHTLRIERVRYSQFSQIARTIAAIGPRYFTMIGDVPSTTDQPEAGLDGVLVHQGAGRPTPRVHLRNTVVFDVTLPFTQAIALCHKWPLSAPLLDQVYIRTSWQESHISNGSSPLPADQSAWRVFSNFCQLFYPNEDAKTTRTVFVGSKHCGMSCRISRGPNVKRYLQVSANVSGLQDPRLRTIAFLLSHLTVLSDSSIHIALTLQDPEPGQAVISIEDSIPLWKAVDDALSLLNYNDTFQGVYVELRRWNLVHAPSADSCRCIQQVARALLPIMAARGLISARCPSDELCVYHMLEKSKP